MADELFKTKSQGESDDRLEAHLETIKPPQEGAGDPATEPATPTETPPAETPAEPTTPPVETPAAETPAEQKPGEEPVETPAEPETPPETGGESFKLVNEKFGTSFEDDATLQAFLQNKDEIDRLKGVESEHDELKTKYEEAKSQLDPRKHFRDDEEYKRQLILMKYGEDVNPAFLNKIISKDINEMSDLDVLTLGKQASNPNISNADDAVQLIYNDLRIEPDEDGKLSHIDNLKLSDASVNVRRELNKIKDIEIPEVTDFEAARQQKIEAGESALKELEGKWNTVIDKMVEGFTDYHMYEDKDGKKESYYSYSVDDDFKSMAKEALMKDLIDRGVDLTEDTIRQARVYLESEFWHQRGQDIMRSYGTSIESRLTEAKMKEDDNPKPKNNAETPASEADKQKEDLVNYIKDDVPTGKLKLG